MTKSRLVLLSTDPAATQLIAAKAAELGIEIVSAADLEAEARQGKDCIVVGCGSNWESLSVAYLADAIDLRFAEPLYFGPELDPYHGYYGWEEANLPEPIEHRRALLSNEAYLERTVNRLAVTRAKGLPSPVKGIGLGVSSLSLGRCKWSCFFQEGKAPGWVFLKSNHS